MICKLCKHVNISLNSLTIYSMELSKTSSIFAVCVPMKPSTTRNCSVQFANNEARWLAFGTKSRFGEPLKICAFLSKPREQGYIWLDLLWKQYDELPVSGDARLPFSKCCVFFSFNMHWFVFLVFLLAGDQWLQGLCVYLLVNEILMIVETTSWCVNLGLHFQGGVWITCFSNLESCGNRNGNVCSVKFCSCIIQRLACAWTNHHSTSAGCSANNW